MIRALAAAGAFPAEVSVRRPTLEAVFIELTAEGGADAAAASAAPTEATA